MNNKLFCTFTLLDDIDKIIDTLTTSYTLLYPKIFVLQSIDSDEFICTYNLDIYNMSKKHTLPGTILVHRKKEFNVLYTINALNEIIKQKNNNRLNSTFKVDWSEFKNSILLIRNNDINILNTKLYKIVDL